MKLDIIKAQEAKTEKIEWAKANLRLEWEDMPHWRDLAKKYSFRLPAYYQPGTESKYLKRLLKQHGVDSGFYLQEICGVRAFKELYSLNPTFPAFVEVGLALEHIDETKNSYGNSA